MACFRVLFLPPYKLLNPGHSEKFLANFALPENLYSPQDSCQASNLPMFMWSAEAGVQSLCLCGNFAAYLSHGQATVPFTVYKQFCMLNKLRLM